MASPISDRYPGLRDEISTLQDPETTIGKDATPHQIDFTFVYDSPDEPMGHKPFPVPFRLTPDARMLTRTQINNRARRIKRKKLVDNPLKPYELAVKYAKRKPIEEWDAEELARGRPRNKDGSFTGPKPNFVTMAVHEEAVEKFARYIKTEMSVSTISAIEQINAILSNEETDYRGKPVVSSATKLDAAKFLIEHLVGKPTQRIESDVSVKLQSILGSVIVNPENDPSDFNALNGYSAAHYPGLTMELAQTEEDNNGGE